MRKQIYLDHAATTPVDPQVLKAMLPFFGTNFGNPSALYQAGLTANGALSDARRTIAAFLRTQPDTIIFTSGGTESDNLAIVGVGEANVKSGRHIVSIAIEHSAVLAPLERLKSYGFEITFVPVDKNGLVRAGDVIAALRPDTVLVSIMYANNEIGAIEPIAEIGRHLLRYRKKHNTPYPYFHSDACQAAGYLDLDVEKLHVDLLTLNANKIYGPKGAGCLYVRRGVKLAPMNLGGSQERGLRSGTENLPGIVGLAKALQLAEKNKIQETRKQTRLSEYFFKKLISLSPSIALSLNGPAIGDHRLPNNLNITIPGIEAEALVIYLDAAGIACSTGSACTAISSTPSNVLKAIGKTDADIRSSIRFTIGKTTTKQDIDYVIKVLPQSIKKLEKSL